MAKSEFPVYIEEVLRLKNQYKNQIEVLLGVESDFFPAQLDSYQRIYQKYPFDYIIGSVHFSGKGELFQPDNKLFNKERWIGVSEQEMLQEKERYYDLIQQSARSGIFDVLGHIDAIKGFNTAISDIYTSKVEEAIKVIAENGVAIEVNTSAKLKDPDGWYPSDEILEMAYHYGVFITFGSDAHTPARIGDDWEAVCQRLKSIGFDKMVYFQQRQRVEVEI